MSLIINRPLVIVCDRDDPSKEMAYWAEMQREPKREARRASRSAGVGLVLVMGLLAWVFIEVVKGF